MNFRIVSALLTVLLLWSIQISTVEAVNLEQGKQIFNAICSSCHARGGNVIMGNKTLQKHVLEKYSMASTDAIVQQVTYGKNAMPAFEGRLSSEQIESVAAYVLEQAEQGWRKKR
ncbi:cytochrome c6 PetJ [Roseofilum casamattae]|uniref:Cytochrome c6 n=1 Tax=Roseofilum casamattae BLCC-M143 TaxID=3022442 RepID=A0ABT7C0T2_9CYAN|nr:c-type cytochrome [Roseofilum casamattae]MDJ1184296.1 c-type cytochrome [Roseofilum casamattae BLCC-M143]